MKTLIKIKNTRSESDRGIDIFGEEFPKPRDKLDRRQRREHAFR